MLAVCILIRLPINAATPLRVMRLLSLSPLRFQRPLLVGPYASAATAVCCCVGLIYPMDTYRGFHKIGFNPFLSFFAIFVIHGTFSWPSQGSWLPDPLFSLNTANVHRTKHGSDTESYDTEGRFNPVSIPMSGYHACICATEILTSMQHSQHPTSSWQARPLAINIAFPSWCTPMRCPVTAATRDPYSACLFPDTAALSFCSCN